MEYRELLRTLDNDESVRTFMDGKLNERGEMAQHAVNARRDKARAKHLKEVSVMIDDYKKAFEVIYKSYGEKSPEELLDMLKQKEGDNFTTYQC